MGTSQIKDRLPTLDALRGVAALAVAWFHFTNWTDSRYLPIGFVNTTGLYGRLGVDVFFVISGFVIPFALLRGGYRVGDYPRFMFKRVVRLDPPYFVMIVLLVLMRPTLPLPPDRQCGGTTLDPLGIAAHLGYVNAVFGRPWLNPVFWTLAVEFQYYLFVGLAFPLLCGGSRTRRWVVLVALVGVSLIPVPTLLVTRFFPLFLMGVAVLWYRSGECGRSLFVAVLAGLGAAVTFGLSPPQAVAGVATAALIAFVRIDSPVLTWFGSISYSLYLIHIPVGGHVLEVAAAFTPSFGGRMAGVACAMVASVGTAWVMHRFVERPAARWSSTIRYQRSPEMVAS